MSASTTIDRVVRSRLRDLGDGFQVRRSLPAAAQRSVGPFVFFDHFGPLQLPPGHGLDVRPHPHIGLATVTYLLEGEIVHRDSLGSQQVISSGDVNWMIAGRGIVHSERSDAAARARGPRLHGLQLWVALPAAHEESAPSFDHHPVATLPTLEGEGVKLRVIAGHAYGQTSPVRALSPLFYVDAQLASGSTLLLPDDHAERAFYVIEGAVKSDGVAVQLGELAIVTPERRASVEAPGGARLAVLGGAALDGPRHIEWNFVSSRPERIVRAKDDWRQRRFPVIPGDDVEFIPLPET